METRWTNRFSRARRRGCAVRAPLAEHVNLARLAAQEAENQAERGGFARRRWVREDPWWRAAGP